MNSKWYYRAQGTEQGPVELKVISSLVAEGTINARTLIRPEDSSDWSPLKELFDLENEVHSDVNTSESTAEHAPPRPEPPKVPSKTEATEFASTDNSAEAGPESRDTETESADAEQETADADKATEADAAVPKLNIQTRICSYSKEEWPIHLMTQMPDGAWVSKKYVNQIYSEEDHRKRARRRTIQVVSALVIVTTFSLLTFSYFVNNRQKIVQTLVEPWNIDSRDKGGTFLNKVVAIVKPEDEAEKTANEVRVRVLDEDAMTRLQRFMSESGGDSVTLSPDQWPQVILANDVDLVSGATFMGGSGFLMESLSGEIVGVSEKRILSVYGIDSARESLDEAFDQHVKSWGMFARQDRSKPLRFDTAIPPGPAKEGRPFFLMAADAASDADLPATPIKIRERPIKNRMLVYIIANHRSELKYNQLIYKGRLTEVADDESTFSIEIEKLRNESKFAGSPVIDEDGRLVGIVRGRSALGRPASKINHVNLTAESGFSLESTTLGPFAKRSSEVDL